MTWLKSAGVGVAATVVDLVALAILVEVLGWSPALANVPALILGLAVQFGGNKWFAFEDRSTDYARQGGQFLVVEAGAFALNALVFFVLVTVGAPYILSRVVASAGVYFGFSYPLWKRIFTPAPVQAER